MSASTRGANTLLAFGKHEIALFVRLNREAARQDSAAQNRDQPALIVSFENRRAEIHATHAPPALSQFSFVFQEMRRMIVDAARGDGGEFRCRITGQPPSRQRGTARRLDHEIPMHAIGGRMLQKDEHASIVRVRADRDHVEKIRHSDKPRTVLA